MKVRRAGYQKPFTAFTIEITIETKEEAQALYAIFNKTTNTELLSNIVSEEIRELIGTDFYVNDMDAVISNGITYAKFYHLLKCLTQT